MGERIEGNERGSKPDFLQNEVLLRQEAAQSTPNHTAKRVRGDEIWYDVVQAMEELKKDPQGETARMIRERRELAPVMLEAYNIFGR